MMNSAENSLLFGYDASSLRTWRIVNEDYTEYTYIGTTLVSQNTDGEIINFSYSASGAPYGFTLNGTSYFYLLNLQGDVIGIYDSNGNIVVQYVYDSWGKLISITGSLADTVGVKNPLRYRGYYYDTLSGLYYLQSRYYDPETGRFISSDTLLIAGNDTIQGTNLFSYCYNNPIMYIDPTGRAAYDINELLKGALMFGGFCDYFGFDIWIPGISEFSGEIVAFEYATLWEFNMPGSVATILNIANDAIVGTIISSFVSRYIGGGHLVGVFTKTLKKYAPKTLGVLTAVTESTISEYLGSINIFSDVTPGRYVLMSFLFMEEGTRHEYIPHVYYVLKYLEPNQKSSLELMLYKIGLN